MRCQAYDLRLSLGLNPDPGKQTSSDVGRGRNFSRPGAKTGRIDRRDGEWHERTAGWHERAVT